MTDGTNTLSAVANIERIIGGSGDNTFIFENGAVFTGTIDGGTGGMNTLDYAAWTTSVTVDLAGGLATGTSGVSNIRNVRGGSAADVLKGDGQANVLTGGGGNDVLTGRAGDDTYRITDGGGTDTIVEVTGEGSDTLDYSLYTSAVVVNLGAGTATATAGVASIENVTGGAGNDVIIGDDNPNVLYGGAGNDTITGGAGADVLGGGTGANTLTGGTEDDTYMLAGGTATIVENADEGSDTLDYSAYSSA